MITQPAVTAPLAVGIVGAGRSRNGLGPFLATFLERNGCRVTAVAGRSVARTAENAAALAQQLRHDVHPCRDLDDLCASGIAAVVIASPPEHHLAALRAALSAGLPVLCEKPLVHEDHVTEAASLVSGFGDAGLLLAENCHWPFVLPALRELYGDPAPEAVRRVSFGLASVKPGRIIVQNTLSHLLSLAQAVAHVDDAAAVESVSLDQPSPLVIPNVLRCHLRGPRLDLDLALHLDLCLDPPRPAWLAIDDVRVDRRIGCDRAVSFAGNGREISVPDPMEQLVSRFATALRAADAAYAAEEGQRVRQRLRLYRDVLSRLQ